MAFTPGQGLKITPSNSPYYRPSGTKSPSKTSRASSETTLSLRQIIGTTTNSPNGFDCLSAGRCFAYTAGAAAVVVKVDDEYKTSQKFFRARPNAVPLASSGTPFNPSTPTPNIDNRNRAVTSLRDAGLGISPGGAGGSPIADWGDSPLSKSWSSRERIKAATCVSFSPDGRHLAVGETGYNPRVLVFSTAPDALTDTPLAVLTEHTFGIRCVAFSPDSRYLASLGTINDGFLHIWAMNPRTGGLRLHSSNKCTTYVRHMAWMGGCLVTVGTRHVKVWRIEEATPNSPSKPKVLNDGPSTPQLVPMNPLPKSLSGRNCLLGPLADGIFTCVTPISMNKAVACTERGDICLIDDTDGTQRLNKVAHAGFGVTCVTVDSDTNNVWVSGKSGKIRNIVLNKGVSPETPPESPTPSSESPERSPRGRDANMTAMGRLGDCLITVDSYHSIRMTKIKPLESDLRIGSAQVELQAHREAVKGVKLLPRPSQSNAAFFTWSSDGSVLFWDFEGRHQGSMNVELEQFSVGDDGLPNELRVMEASPDADFFVSGDRYGVLRIIDGDSRKCVYDIKAHGSEMTDIAIHQTEKITIVASCARDRTVQLFRKQNSGWTLIQTMDEHQGSVGRLLFAKKGEKLLSCSSDRSIVIREFVSKDVDGDLIMAYLLARTITLKATPVSMTLHPDQEDTLIVSTIDRHVHKFDLRSGRSVHSFKATDSDNNDAVVLDALAMSTGESLAKGGLLAAVSTSDKSIRTYNHLGVCLDKDFGHTEGVTDMVMVANSADTSMDSNKNMLISTGSDGTVMIWDILLRPPPQDLLDSPQFSEEVTPVKETTAAQKPLRRILSRSELAEFQRPSDSESATPISTPTGRTSPPRSLRKKTSKYSLAQSPRLGIPPMPSYNSATPSPIPSPGPGRKSSIRDRSPSPPSPKRLNGNGSRRPSFDNRSRTKSAGNVSEFGSLGMSTEQVCRTLRAYRKKLVTSSDALRIESIRELEKELNLTSRALAERELKIKTGDDEALSKLLEQYSEKMADMVDEKVAWKVRGKSRSGSESPGEKVLGTSLMMKNGV